MLAVAEQASSLAGIHGRPLQAPLLSAPVVVLLSSAREPDFDDDLFMAYEPSFWHAFTEEDLAGRARSTRRPESIPSASDILEAQQFSVARAAPS